MNKVEVINKMGKAVKEIGVTNKYLDFACYSDGIFTYETKYPVHLEMSFISEAPTLLDKMHISDLFNLRGLAYMHFKTFTGKKYDITFNINDAVNVN